MIDAREAMALTRREQIRQAIATLCLRAGGETIISTKGGLQKWLIDLRCAFLHAETLESIADAFWDLHREEPPFQIAGMETAAIPLLTAILLRAPDARKPVNGIIIRKERKTTGLGNSIEGVPTGEPIILVDDILNSGASAEKARATMTAHNLPLSRMFAVIDYETAKGRRWKHDNRISVQSLFKLGDFDLALHRNPPPPVQKYRQLWATSVPGGFAFYVVPKSAPVPVENLIYRGCDAGKMHAFDPKTGKIVWEYATTGAAKRKGIWSTPAFHDGKLYFGAYNGVAYCLDAKTGAEVWTQSYGEWIGASPLIVPQHNLVCFGIEYERPWAQGSIGALDLATGQKRWEHLVKKYQHGSPAYWAGGDLVIWGSADHEMLGLEAASGKIRWSFKTGRSVKYAPSVCETRKIVAFASFDKSIYVLDVTTGEKLGRWKTAEICYTTPLIHHGRLFCGSGDRHLYVIDLNTMKLLRKIEVGARVYSSPIALEDRVVFGTSGGKIIEIDARSLEFKGILQLSDAVTNAVAVSPDKRQIFVSTYMNQLCGFERL